MPRADFWRGRLVSPTSAGVLFCSETAGAQRSPPRAVAGLCCRFAGCERGNFLVRIRICQEQKAFLLEAVRSWRLLEELQERTSLLEGMSPAER